MDEPAHEVARRLARIEADARRRAESEVHRPIREERRRAAPHADQGSVVLGHVLYLFYLVFLLLYVFTELPGSTLFVAGLLSHVMMMTKRDTWLESHFRWQARTFWIALIGSFAVMALLLLLIGSQRLASVATGVEVRKLFGTASLFPVTIALGALLAWYLYRVVKGWWRLYLHREMD